MRSLFASVLVVGLAAFTAGAQSPWNISPSQPPRPQPSALPEHYKEPLAPGNLDLIGMPIAPPPVTSWPVGEAVTEFKPGVVYVYWINESTASINPIGAQPSHRQYFGQLPEKHVHRVVVVELIAKDRKQFTIAGELAESAAQDPFVRTPVGICAPAAFEMWCGTKRRGGGFLAVIVDGHGRLAFVGDSYADVPWVTGQVIEGKFDHAAYLDRVRAWNEAVHIVGQVSPEDRLKKLEAAYELLPCRYADTEVQRARLLIQQKRGDEAAAAIRSAIDQATLIDRRFLQDVVTLAETFQGWAEAMRPIMLDAAKTLAATSDMQSCYDLKQVARIASVLRDYDTAIEYQTMAVARAHGDSEREEAVKKLREYEAAKGK